MKKEDLKGVKLEIGHFSVKDIQFGEKTSFADGVLTVNCEEAIAEMNKENRLKNITLYIARPGDSTRIVPVKTTAAVRFRPDGRPAFPGYTGQTQMAGSGVSYAMDGMCVVAAGIHSRQGMNGMIDMSGPGAELSPYSRLLNLVFVAENADPAEDIPFMDNVHYMKASCYLAEYLGKALDGQTPESWETYEWEPCRDNELPRVAFFMQQCNIPKWLNGTSYYGYELNGIPTTIVQPLEWLDGALTGDGGSLPANGLRTTYSFLNAPIIKRLLREHGKTINLVCTVLIGHVEPVDDKQRVANMYVSLAKTLGLDAVIEMESHCGNVDVDFMMTMGGLERAGIKTVGIFAENVGRDGRNPGKTYTDGAADALVSTGNACQVYELPAMETVLGNLGSYKEDPYWGAWFSDAIRGPSLRDDGPLIVDAHAFVEHDGLLGTSLLTVKDF